ncbi:MAG TPA: phosphoribosyltransferase family protein [Bacteroidia bacterium]|nr:phosphoribosyltransferase [Bacteroidia bacterium]HRD39253.1 phosphoribosyltransferase family protein [Bacteroidia bacterium]
MAKTKILDSTQISRKLNRMAYEVYEKNYGEREILLVGIDGNGYKVAQRLQEILAKISNIKIKLSKIKLDKNEPWTSEPKLDFSEKDYINKSVIIVDDVLNSGKTVMYAIKPFLDSSVKRLNVLVLVDRSHSRYPVKADFVGMSLSTTMQEHIEADFSKKGNEAVYLI